MSWWRKEEGVNLGLGKYEDLVVKWNEDEKTLASKKMKLSQIRLYSSRKRDALYNGWTLKKAKGNISS